MFNLSLSHFAARAYAYLAPFFCGAFGKSSFSSGYKNEHHALKIQKNKN